LARVQKNSPNVSFGGLDLHDRSELNPYQAVCSALGNAVLEMLDSDRKVPVVGFGDAATVDTTAGCFLVGCTDRTTTLLSLYDDAASRFYDTDLGPASLVMSGPTSFAGVIRLAIEECRRLPDRLHVLIIITDGAINDTSARVKKHGELVLDLSKSPTAHAIVDASEFPLYIIIVGVGDGPWGLMESLDDELPERRLDNVQFTNFLPFQGRMHDPEAMAEFTRLCLVELPFLLDSLGTMGWVGPRASAVASFPPPPLLAPRAPPGIGSGFGSGADFSEAAAAAAAAAGGGVKNFESI
jgi:E3 ubiquitin-protein ligase RGLG